MTLTNMFDSSLIWLEVDGVIVVSCGAGGAAGGASFSADVVGLNFGWFRNNKRAARSMKMSKRIIHANGPVPDLPVFGD